MSLGACATQFPPTSRHDRVRIPPGHHHKRPSANYFVTPLNSNTKRAYRVLLYAELRQSYVQTTMQNARQGRLVAPAEPRLDMFVCYSRVDAVWLRRVQVHLKPLVREGRLDLWDDTRIKAGERWREEIRTALARARVAVLLISADFFDSDFIAEKELPPLLEAERVRGLVILGVHINFSRFDRDRVLSEYQTINTPGQPIEDLSKARQERVFDGLARRIEELLDPPNP